ncbi:polyketide cyclase/dehydrase/lipid transport protein [Anseongella ginsenosidimutans]|uniref:Polyketide cyclase/dehydrase/lipid transport protein n=1 Tax=Anseongella ginsenosidimutans TaxID=496056 RepID=A0A4R3KS43_9SPHI|nr:SRPBCC family protein [Anseongella ginsenosidimutans]QEC52869.1 hypothetical protein FRZ59_11350 [Anseongella ginsenosidimutans]TCS87259.1 polyketide cyclase/dehydrase/lipid transport protein [Anseongella ginsenosidimutans]
MKKKYESVSGGLISANIIALAIMGLSKKIPVLEHWVLIFSAFILLPLFMGIVSAWCWRNLGMKTRALIGYSVLNGAIAILLSFLFLGEGVICLLIVSPLIFGFVISGAFAGRRMFRKNDTTLNICVFSLLFLVFIADLFSDHHYENLVSDEITIKASPEEVWKNIVAFEKIEKENEFWLFKLGMPSPVEATVEGYYKGAGRKCIFSNGYVFDEKIVVFEPGHDLTFDITGQPRDPEIMGHIDILRGQFLLKDNGDGSTTLTGKSWYRLYIFPSWYFDLWARSITRNVHLRVMEHVRQLSEKQ